jgi:hypothetical protein
MSGAKSEPVEREGPHRRSAWLLAAFLPVAFHLTEIEMWIWAAAVIVGSVLRLFWRSDPASEHWSSILPWVAVGVLAQALGTNAHASTASGSTTRTLVEAAFTIGIGCALVVLPLPAPLHKVGAWMVIVAFLCWIPVGRRGSA